MTINRHSPVIFFDVVAEIHNNLNIKEEIKFEPYSKILIDFKFTFSHSVERKGDAKKKYDKERAM